MLTSFEAFPVVVLRGTSNNNNMAAFRETYSGLHELRSLAPSVKMIALTATATASTRKTITEVLMMENAHVVYENPGKMNIAYSVHYMEKDKSVEDYFQWLAEEIKELKNKATRTIIYCQTIKQCGLIYSTIRGMLGNELYADSTKSPQNVVLEMLHSCSPEKNKEAVLNAFQKEDSCVRVLVATIAFGMGVDCKGVHRTVHFGPSKNIEAYIQETGRAGRDGKQSVGFLVYHGLLLNHVDKDMKHYVKTGECRRRTLLQNFDGTSALSSPQPLHMCCDNCAADCKCGASDCGHLTKFPALSETENECLPLRTRQGTREQEATVYEHLCRYHKSLVMELVRKTGEDLKTLTNPQILLGFSEIQISQVVENVAKLFTIDDVCSSVEIWHMRHAYKVLDILDQVYGDVGEIAHLFTEDQFDHEPDDFIEQWDELLHDDSLFEMAIENLSLSQLELSTCDDVSFGSCEVPSVACNALDKLSVYD